MKKITFTVFIVFAALLCMTVIVRTQEVDNRGVCRADHEKFCKDVKPGQGRIFACLKNHEAELSEQCKTHMADTREKTEGFVKAC